MRLALVALALAVYALPPQARAAEDKFTGAWESRVEMERGSYAIRLKCRSASDCDMQMGDAGTAGKKAGESTLAFRAAVPFERDIEAARKALRYAREHRAASAVNPEFAAIHKSLAASVDAKTEVETCIGLDDKSPEYFVVCTVRGATSWRPMLLLFGKLLGPCTQGFCGYVVYPLVKTGS